MANTGIKVQLPFVSSNQNLRKFREDKRLTAGSLLLIDFSHTFLKGISVPGNGGTFKNIAYKEAMALLNTTVETNVTPSVVNTLTQNGGQAEFTSKRGLHAIISQINDIADGNDFTIKIPNMISDYIKANVNRGIFISIWNKTTRMFSGTGVSSDFLLSLTNTGNYIASLEQGGFLGTNNIGKNSEAAALNAVKRNTVAISSNVGTPATGNSSYNSGYIFTGNTPYTSFELNKKASKVLYQIHIIDLTSAGLTYDQANQADLANYTAAFGTGGRFENDTFTNPSTFL